ncbi:bifunctional proline dehydrogenase/L-glutamate gamma-semialdehyde dehydrogenase PutA [Geminicoccaceae bacterium 1502E]|nr:bifunctional proline dehydrogenase/L-glutamate gamma-semialdehyde dehydrogenase PutA [Geminicoccaceae bacterium 1502E]
MSGARARVRELGFADESERVRALLAELELVPARRQAVASRAAEVVGALREVADPGLMERFLAEYGLGTEEGIALMCLAEAYLRTPDARSLDALISDKIGGGDWTRHRGKAESALINASTWALMLTGRLFGRIPADAADLGATMHGIVRRLGEPVARKAVGEAMKILGRQFVLGRNIDEALKNAQGDMREGWLHSFDMLGEAARTSKDAYRYFLSYSAAISAIAEHARGDDPHGNPGISVKLSALHPRYEQLQRDRVMMELVPRVAALAEHARAANIGFAVDAEEADRLDLSLDVIEAVLRSSSLKGWDGFGVVVQAYAKTAPAVIDWLHGLCERLDRRISVRLVKGAYWDTEIKIAQLQGIETYPVYTRKESTDLAYLVCAQRLFACADRIYPQFATHNAHTICAVNELAPEGVAFEFQRLHGMGEALHGMLRKEDGRRRRIYAPVGVHEDLLAYLVRRLLENGANSSFVHQILDKSIPPAVIARDPVSVLEQASELPHPGIPLPPRLFGSARRNSRGWNLYRTKTLEELDAALAPFRDASWRAAPGPGEAAAARPVTSPVDPRDVVGEVVEATAEQAGLALGRAAAAQGSWEARGAGERAAILERAAELYEAHAPELFAIATREAGKTRLDGVAEVREAVDFLRYYAAEGRRVFAAGGRLALGPIVCISPWNFPLAIFTGQIAAALMAGNTVLAKPAEQTPLIAARAVALLHEAGVPEDVLQLLPGDGAIVGAALTCDPRTKGVCFTGSTETAQAIDRAMAQHGDARAPLVAETGGLNAMIVDSTALPEQAVRDIVVSAFQSAGQRCSALRVLLVQEEVAPSILEMLEGAARELVIGDPWHHATDVGPVIDEAARKDILEHCARLEGEGRLLFRVELPDACPPGTFVAPCAFRLDSLDQLGREVFGPVLHVVRYAESRLEEMVDRINALGYGLTLGIHSRIDARVDAVCARARIGNIYVNRNQIGAVVGVQPFGGEGLSGTGPKAGGPNYLTRFTRPTAPAVQDDRPPGAGALLARLDPALQAPAREALLRARQVSTAPVTLPGPTGERNTFLLGPRGAALCLGPDAASLAGQAALAFATGNAVLLARAADADAAAALAAAINAEAPGRARVVEGEPARLAAEQAVEAVLLDALDDTVRDIRQALARRDGPRVPLLRSTDDAVRLCVERAVSEDTTASGGNPSLLGISAA